MSVKHVIKQKKELDPLDLNKTSIDFLAKRKKKMGPTICQTINPIEFPSSNRKEHF